MSNKLYAKSGYMLTLIAQSVSLVISMLLSQTLKSEAQSVIPAPDGTGTQVRIYENQIQIYGGSLSSDEANLFHSLQQFGLTEGQIANFLANPNLNNIVTRITGGDPSVINGVLQVTGGDPNLFLMNPSGIIFGATAQLNLPASFAATTANGIQFGNQWFSATGANNYGNLVGNPTAFYFDSNAGTIINAGNLAVNPQHSLLLLGGSVINTGQLSVPEGQVLVTAVPDRNVLHLQVPGNILTLEVELPDELAAQPHTWTLPIAALPELLTSEAMSPESLGLTITDAGDVQLAGSNMRIPNQAGTAIASGVIDVSGDQGGSVGVFGDLVGVADAQVNASGTLGGGTVLVGGEYRGQGTVPTAERTYIDSDSSIAADALTSGDGGRVIVWADGTTAFYGGITARGGAIFGNGGFAEVSGREYLVFDGMANLSSEQGIAGILLLDPLSIKIANNVDDSEGIQEALPIILENDFPSQIINISQNTLESIVGNIRLEATDSITIGSLDLVETDSVFSPTLTLNGNIEFIVTGGDFTMDSTSRVRTVGGGNIRIEAQNIQAGFLRTDNSNGNAGSVNLVATQGDIEAEIRAIVLNDSEAIIGNGGDISLTAENGGITVNNNLVSFSANGNGGDITLRARDNIVINCNTSANYCVESFAGGDPNKDPLGDSGNISFISTEGSVIVDGASSLALNSGNSGTEDGGNAGSIDIQASTGISIEGIIDSQSNFGTAGSVDFESEEINLTGNLTVRPGTASVLFGGSVDGSSGLFIETTSGNVEINGSVGSNSPLQSFLVSNANTISIGGSISTSGGDISFSANDTSVNGDITAVSGSIDFSAGNSASNVNLFRNVSASSGNIVFNVPVIVNNPIEINAAQGLIEFNSSLSAGSNNLNLVANEIDIAGSISGSNSLVISATSTQGIDLGGNAIDANLLNLSATELNLLNGFSNVTIDADANPITISSPITLNTSTQLLTTGNVNINANVTTLGQDLTFDSNAVLGNDVQISTGAGSGNLVFWGSISSIDETEDGADYGLTLEAGTGQVQFLDTVSVRELSILSAQALLIETGITTNNTDLTFNIPVILTGDTVTFSTQSRQTDGAGDITFNNTLNSEANETNNLELTPGAENVTFDGVVGTNNSQRLGNITLGRFNTFTNNATIRASRIQQTAGTLGQTATLSGNINTTGSGVSLTTIGDITANNLSRTGGSTTLVSRDGGINVTDVTATDGNFSATARSGVTATTLNSATGAVSLRSGAGNVQATDVSAAGDVAAIANTGVTANNIDSTGGDVTLRSGTANVQATDISAAGDVTAISARNVIATDINSTGGRITAVANNGAVQVNNLTSNGDVSVTALGTIRSTNGITSNGGDISLSSPQSITTETLTSNGGGISLGNNGGATGSIQVTGDINASGVVNGGDVEIISEAAIDLPNTNINTSGRTGIGGDITLQSIGGRIAVNNLTATGRTGGGNVSVIASELEDLAITLSIGEIDTSASIGDGGDVLLDPFGNIQVSFINAQGGISGIGGDVTAITTGGLFRAIDSFIDQNGVNASISAAGGAGEGSISIFHNGGDLFIPFFVAVDGVDISAANASGTVGALTTGDPAVNEDNIIENRVFPGTFVQDRIGIFTSDRYTLALANTLPDAEPDDLQLADADQQPFWLDEYFTRRTEEYLGRGFDTDVKSLEEIQDDLRRIEEETGVKPALIYVVFEPEQVLQTIAEGGPGSPDDLVNQGWLQRFREMGSDRLQLVLVTSEGQPIFRRPDDPEATRENVPVAVDALRTGIADDFSDYVDINLTLPSRYLPSAQQLYAWLLEPLQADLHNQEIQNLVFIMDAGLRSTPLAALPVLHDGESFIIEKYSVGLMPSFSLTDTRYQNLVESDIKVLAMGMSNFEQYPLFRNLNAAKDELRLITELWTSTQSDNSENLNQGFTQENILLERRINPSGILHFATHTAFNPGTPSNSYIQLWDQQLRFDELQSLRLNEPIVELLVLSSCSTALSSKDESTELGFAGLSVQAGVKSSLASLWEVDDYGTLALMVEFYSHLQSAPTKAEALRQAQLSMLNRRVFIIDDLLTWSLGTANLDITSDSPRHLDHPGYWAGFTIVGSPW